MGRKPKANTSGGSASGIWLCDDCGFRHTGAFVARRECTRCGASRDGRMKIEVVSLGGESMVSLSFDRLDPTRTVMQLRARMADTLGIDADHVLLHFGEQVLTDDLGELGSGVNLEDGINVITCVQLPGLRLHLRLTYGQHLDGSGWSQSRCSQEPISVSTEDKDVWVPSSATLQEMLQRAGLGGPLEYRSFNSSSVRVQVAFAGEEIRTDQCRLAEIGVMDGAQIDVFFPGGA